MAVIAFTTAVHAEDSRQLHLQFTQTVQPLLKKFCYECHGDQSPMAELNLVKYQTPRQVIEARKTWQNILAKIGAREMPPEQADAQPTVAQRAQLTSWIDAMLKTFDCNGSPEPGKVTLRRLTRYEYRNSVRELTGIDYEPAEDFPADDTGYGFDNIGDVLSLPPILFEKYLLAAEQIASKAIVILPETTPIKLRVVAADMQVVNGRVDDVGLRRRGLMTNAALSFSLSAPQAGEYEIIIEAGGDQAGPEPPKMGLLLDGKQIKQFPVKNGRTDGKQFTLKRRLTKGSHTIGVEFLNDFFNEKQPDPAKRDRNLIVYNVRVTGPSEPAIRNVPDSHKRIMIASPDGNTSRRQASEKVLRRLASWAFRRPVTDSELSRLVALTEQAAADGESFEQGIQLALQAILVSPHFIYKIELDPLGKQGQSRDLNEFEVATRLSYFLWSSSPDAELLGKAINKTLLDDGILVQQASRLLKDPRSKALVENFVGQWLQLRNLEDHQPDASTFPAYDAKLRAAIRRETELFVESVLREDRSVVELLSADFTFVNEPLARLYGMPGVQGDRFRRVSTEGTKRGGILTQASFLTVTSNPNRTSPVKRGKFILDKLLGIELPPPPPNVPELKLKKVAGTLRQQMEQHRANALCASCHQRMDPIGFALENFDGIGRWRDQDDGVKIDASGQLPSGVEINGAAELRALLVSQKDRFVESLTEKLLTYALGRGLEYYDQCAVDEIVRNVKAADYRFSALILEIVRSDPFLKKGNKDESP